MRQKSLKHRQILLLEESQEKTMEKMGKIEHHFWRKQRAPKSLKDRVQALRGHSLWNKTSQGPDK